PDWALLPARRGRRPARIPVAERWVAALTGADSQVEVSSAEDETAAAELAASLAAWRDAAQAPAGPVRTCFRLVEPGPVEPGPAEPGPAEPGPAEPSETAAGPGALATEASAAAGNSADPAWLGADTAGSSPLPAEPAPEPGRPRAQAGP